MKNIALVGAGNIGSRHIQAIKKINDYQLHLFVVDPNPDSLKTAKFRCDEVKPNPLVNIDFHTSISEIPLKLDVGIISTTSDFRLSVLKDLVKNSTLDFIIFEKILFQKLSEYELAKNILKDNKINAWVNCWPRTLKFFQKVKNNLKSQSINSINVYGSNWGLASNAIHMIDLMSFLFENTNYKIKDIINPQVVKKITSENILKKNHYDLTGSLIGTFNEIPFSISSFKGGSIPLTIEFIFNDSIQTVDLRNKLAYYSSSTNRWARNLSEIEIPLQSESTNIILKKIFEGKNPRLSDFESSSILHSIFLRYLFKNFKNSSIIDGEKCLIT